MIGPHSGMNAAADGRIGKHGGLVTANVMVDTVGQEKFGCIHMSPGVSSVSQLALLAVVDGTTRGVMHFVTTEEHPMATHVAV